MTTEQYEVQQPDRLVWIDLEMTGLDVTRDSIIEIATIITDAELNVIAEGPDIPIHQPDEIFDKVDATQRTWLDAHGLIEASRASTTSSEQAEAQTLEFIKMHVPERSAPLCGNSIHMDRRFLALQMPSIDQYLHYRCIDVSSLKELTRRWRPDLYDAAMHLKKGTHRAHDDILESIEELRLYKAEFLKLI